MILEEQIKDMVIVGEDTSKKATISADKMAKLQYLLTKGLYKDPITAVIAEWTNNGVDSVVQSGKNPIDNPVLVIIGKNEKGQYALTVEDKGCGLDKDDFENICMNYLESTKETSNDTIGHFGIGMKSFLSLERSATFTCRKNGIERRYLVYEGSEFVNYDMLYEKVTDEMDGVKAELVINGWDERNLFVQKAKQKLAYYDSAVLVIDAVPIANTINRHELFQWSTLNSNNCMHLCLKDVYYTIDWDALGIRALPVEVALRFDLSAGITPTPSRESYITNEKTKQLIMDRIKEVSKFFVERYNETVKEFDTFLDAYTYLGSTNYDIRLEGMNFTINSLLTHAGIPVLTPKVKGVELKKAYDYRCKHNYFFYQYEPVAYYNSSFIFKTKAGRMGRSIDTHVFDQRKFPVLVGDNFKGNVKEFLKDKYGRETLFVKKRDGRRLGSRKNNGRDTYHYILDLTHSDKSTWRGLIGEFQYIEKTMVDKFHDEKMCHTTPEFDTWLQKKRDEQAQRKKLGYIGYKGLNKQDGEVTMGYRHKYKSFISFKKRTYKIAELAKNQYLTVMVRNEDDTEFMKKLSGMFATDKVRFATVGNKEIKNIPKHFQFVNYQEFMKTKPFARLASSLLFDQLLDDFNKITQYKSGLFQNCLKEYMEDSILLKQYVDKNFKDTGDDDVREAIINVAEEKNLFDKQLWDKYVHLKEGLSKYDFITCLAEPTRWDDAQVKKYERVIAQILLFRKNYYGDLPENARIVFDDVVSVPVEEVQEEDEGELVEENALEELTF